MARKLIFGTLSAGVIVIYLLLIGTFETYAHTQGGPPYVAVNGIYADTAPVVASRLAVPQDLVKKDFLVGSDIHFILDTTRLSIPVTIVGLSNWRWNFEGSTYHDGTVQSHIFSKPGSYIVGLQLSNPAYGKGFRDYDLIQVNVVPQNQYQLPDVTVSASSQKDADGNLIVSFSANTGSDRSTKVKEVTWDFGDGQEAHGSSVTHSYKPFAEEQLVTVRATDENGLFNDSSWKLDSQGNLSRNRVNYSGAAAVGSSYWWVLIALGAVAIFVGSGLTIWKIKS